MLDELHITWIGARSPQAKGRVERLCRTLQDRLYQELRLANISTLEQANAALPALLSRHNARFRQTAAVPGSAYRRLPAGRRPADVFCFRYWRTVSKDNSFRLRGAPSLSRLALNAARTPVHESRCSRTSTAALLCTTRDVVSPAKVRRVQTCVPSAAEPWARSHHRQHPSATTTLSPLPTVP